MLLTQLLNCKNITDKLMTIQADFCFMEDLLVEPTNKTFLFVSVFQVALEPQSKFLI